METAIISGKGGTGKSSITAAFASLSGNIVLADCDVDAANMHILFEPEIENEEIFVSGERAEIDESRCSNCGLCIRYCRFDAISFVKDKVVISVTSCDGCGLCAHVCPAHAIAMIKNDRSRLFSGNFRYGKMISGRLAPGEENSGKLVGLVRERAKEAAKTLKTETILLDGPPGIGCPVISTITGAQNVVIVTEPTLSGVHDLKRTIDVCSKFKLKTHVLVNKFDLNHQIAEEIHTFCDENQIHFAGKVPFDKMFTEAMVQRKSVVEFAPNSEIARILTDIWGKIRS